MAAGGLEKVTRERHAAFMPGSDVCGVPAQAEAEATAARLASERQHLDNLQVRGAGGWGDVGDVGRPWRPCAALCFALPCGCLWK